MPSGHSFVVSSNERLEIIYSIDLRLQAEKGGRVSWTEWAQSVSFHLSGAERDVYLFPLGEKKEQEMEIEGVFGIISSFVIRLRAVLDSALL